MGKVIMSGITPKLTRPGSRLPAGYTELVYIKCSGTQYIDTGLIPNQDTGVWMDCNSALGSTTGALFGGRVSYASRDFSMWVYSATSWLTNYGSTSKEISGTTSGRHKIEKWKNITYVDYAQLDEMTYTSFTAPVSLYIGAANENGVPDGRNFVGDIYAFRIYDSFTLVRDFVPCLSDEKGVGMYELIEGKFYGNAGTGVFIGSEVA